MKISTLECVPPNTGRYMHDAGMRATILAAFSNGDPIEYTKKGQPINWRPHRESVFDFTENMYRVDTTRIQVDWSVLPDWARWVAMDTPTSWVWFEDDPKEQISAWPEKVGRWGTIPEKYAPKYLGSKPWNEVVARRIA